MHADRSYCCNIPVFEFTASLKFSKLLQYFSSGFGCQTMTVSLMRLLSHAHNIVWPNFYLMEIFVAFKSNSFSNFISTKILGVESEDSLCPH